MRIVYNSFHGRFSDSPRALFERLRGRPGLEHGWLAHRDHLPVDRQNAWPVRLHELSEQCHQRALTAYLGVFAPVAPDSPLIAATSGSVCWISMSVTRRPAIHVP